MNIHIIKQRLFEMWGDQVILAPNQEYLKMIEPMTFIDKDYGEWRTSPNNVLNKGCVHPNRKLEKRKATTRRKYGVDNVFQSEEIKTKIKAELNSRYGVDHALQNSAIREKVRKTSIERYGVDHVLKNQEIRDKAIMTTQEKYGVAHAMHCEEIKQKVKNTCLERYGVDNCMKSREVREKAVETNWERYGGVAPACDPAVQEKMRVTNLSRYGGDAPICSPTISEKIAKTNLERYGAANPFASEAIKQMIRTVVKEKYGVEYPAQCEEVRQKMIATCLDRYDSVSPLHSSIILNKIKETNLERYGVEYAVALFGKTEEAKVKKKNTMMQRGFIYLTLPNGLNLGDYLRKFNRIDDLNYMSCKAVYIKYGFEVLQEYVEGERTFNNATSLEVTGSKLLGIENYTKSVKISKSKWRKPDFKLSESIYVDLDGLFPHSTMRKKDNEYHIKKRLDYESIGLRLLQFRENEVRDQPHIVKSIIDNALGRTQKIFARKCTITKVDWKTAAAFLKQNHLQGSGTFATAYGLRDKAEELVMILCVRKKQDGIEISRMCTKAGYTIVGGFSRLLTHAIREQQPTFVSSWCDLRYADGNGYTKLGFEAIRDVPSWAWTDFENIYHRLQCRANMDERKLTEAEHAEEFGWVRIYDAGQRLYTLTV